MLEIATTASPVGSSLFSLLALLVISLIVLLILRNYLPLRTTPAFYLVPLFFALWLPSIIVLLVPVDLASSATTDDDATKGIWLPERVILVSWRISYWLTFSLTWFLLPILDEYSDAGYREPHDKLMYSLRENAQFYAIASGVGILFFGYVTIAHGFTIQSFQVFAMALSYFVGLVLAIYLMGHGLVSIPRTLMRNISITSQLRRIQGKAPRIYEKMEDSLIDLKEVEAQIHELQHRKTGSALRFEDWIEELQDMVHLGQTQPVSASHTAFAQNNTLPSVITEKFLAGLTRRFIRAKYARSRYVSEWSRIVQAAADKQAILDSAASKKLEFDQIDTNDTLWRKYIVLTPYTRHLLHYQVLPYAQAGVGVLLAFASVCIVWSEVIKVAFPRLSIIRVSVIHHWVGDKAQVGFAGQVIAIFWICYMCAAALTSITEVKVWRGRALVKRNTSHESAFWYATQVAKLSVPLSYNFMTFLSPTVYHRTVFYQFLGKNININHLSHWFDKLFPIFILVPCVATLFGLYKKIKRIFVGMDMVDDDEDNESGYGTGSWREGRDLINRELGGAPGLRRRGEPISALGIRGDGERRAPTLSVPAARGTSSSPARSPSRLTANDRRAGQSSRTLPLDEPEDDNIFTIIGHRMKNTVDTIEAPSWFPEFGQGIKKPKWFGGDSGGQGSGGGGSSNNDIARWFGGSGQIRL